MTIYYIDPHTKTNGTGTWASPWSLASGTRTGLASGDEIRIKGVAISSLLTATSYTATVTDNYRLSITAGGGLGADWAPGAIGYLPAFDTFFRVYSVNVNSVQVYISALLPIFNTSTASVTLRQVDTAAYPAGFGSTATVPSNSVVNDLTVSDCWISETVRVTDGTVKTLMYGSTTVQAMLYLGTGTTVLANNHIYNLDNTHLITGRTASNGAAILVLRAKNSTVTINQLYGWASSTYATLSFSASTTQLSKNNTVNIRCLACNEFLLNQTQASLGSDNTVNIEYQLLNRGSDCCTGVNPQTDLGRYIFSNNYTHNVKNIICVATSYSTLFAVFSAPKLTVNYGPGYFDSWTPISLSSLYSGCGDCTFSIDSSFAVYSNRRTATITSCISPTRQEYNPVWFNTLKLTLPTNVPSGWTFTYPNITLSNTQLFASGAIDGVNISVPYTIGLNIPSPTSMAILYANTSGQNILLTYRDGSNPVEYLTSHLPYNSGVQIEGTAATTKNSPFCTIDNSVYNIAAPSLKSYLTTRIANYWIPEFKAKKAIKVPIVAGTSYTITGYIKTDDSTFVNGDSSVEVIYNGTVLDNQDMTTACIGAWEQFSLTFTATETGEANLVWNQFFRNGAKSMWLSDLSIT